MRIVQQVIGLLLGVTVLAGLCAAPARAAVEAREELLTLPYYVMEKTVGADGRERGVPKRGPDQVYRTVVLENEFVRVQLIPELGGVVHRAIDKTTGDDYFFYEGLGKNWYTYWESGIKASFPKAEHSMMNFGQPASYRIYRAADGAVTAAFWMEFSRHNYANPDRHGRYSGQFLSQLVTLRPNEAYFGITYRIENPLPYRAGRRVWNDAFYPRNQTEKGAVQAFETPPAHTDTELVYPTVYLSFHRGEQFRKYDDAKEGRLGDIAQMFNSYFAWDIPYGFAGLWYPVAKVNRLRLWDPRVAPGAKVYFEGEGTGNFAPNAFSNYNFVELWGGTDNLFEGVENWIGPGESFQFTHNFTTIHGIGKVDYADTNVAVNVEFGDAPLVEAVTLHPVGKLSATFNRRRLGAAQPCGPGKPARFTLPKGATSGRLVLTDGRKVILDRRFPLEMQDDTAGHARIKWSLDHKRPSFGEMFSDMPETNMSYRSSIGAYPDGSVGRGRNLLRDGQLDKAIECLQKATASEPNDGEGWHLLGTALLEQGATAEAKKAFERACRVKQEYPPAHYFLALLSVAEKDDNAARRELLALEDAVPLHWEGRLLRAWLEAGMSRYRRDVLERARALEAEDPADPRVQMVMVHAAQAVGDKAAEAQAAKTLEQLRQEPGADARLGEFSAATEGRYVAPVRLGVQKR